MRLFCIWRYYTVYVSSFSDTTNIKPSNSFYNWVYTLEQGTGLHKLWNPANVKFSNWNPKNQLYTQCKILHTVWQFFFSRFYALSSEFFWPQIACSYVKKLQIWDMFGEHGKNQTEIFSSSPTEVFSSSSNEMMGL